MQKIKKQSAFSLIEILISLLILSVCMVGTGKILLKHIAQQQINEQRERITILVWSIVDYLKASPLGQNIGSPVSSWQAQLNSIAPGSHLSIQGKDGTSVGVYVITVNSPTIGKIQLEVIT